MKSSDPSSTKVGTRWCWAARSMGWVCLALGCHAEVSDGDFHENYELLKVFIVNALGSSGIPNLADFKACESHDLRWSDFANSVILDPVIRRLSST